MGILLPPPTFSKKIKNLFGAGCKQSANYFFPTAVAFLFIRYWNFCVIVWNLSNIQYVVCSCIFFLCLIYFSPLFLAVYLSWSSTPPHTVLSSSSSSVRVRCHANWFGSGRRSRAISPFLATLPPPPRLLHIWGHVPSEGRTLQTLFILLTIQAHK